MQQIKLISKLGLTLIAITAIAVAVAIQASYYYIQAADATPEQPPLPPGSEAPSPSLEAPRLPNNIVRSETIVNGQVQTQDLASGAVVPNVHAVSGDLTLLPPGAYGVSSAVCPSGEKVTGGGFNVGDGVQVMLSQPYYSNLYDFSEDRTWDVWVVHAINHASSRDSITVYALCMGPSP
jgi:hypothetical protein